MEYWLKPDRLQTMTTIIIKVHRLTESELLFAITERKQSHLSLFFIYIQVKSNEKLGIFFKSAFLNVKQAVNQCSVVD